MSKFPLTESPYFGGNVVILPMPGHVFSEASQAQRDLINQFIQENNIPDDDVDSIYTDSPGKPLDSSASRLKYIHIHFKDPKMAVLFKLAHG